ncbi:alkaline phosphatase [Nocardioides anomalus]|uniref:Alkaline phosphatase n=1 Tax=Nocardioides anomalus TaxID=2712223 RepID=A0A6G6WGD2_9ACTN|nr:alkaline phosphatase D family protein [Nocardioides anomalus]QIG44292.1 alkaline phosphatase [Nocardioides anomalus]
MVLDPSLSRRHLLAGLAAPVVPAVPFLPGVPALRPAVLRDPFALGVASGDPWPTSVVLWTRLAPEPLADDGLGAMPRRPVVVQWQVAEDEAFRTGLRGGYAVAEPAWAHSVHVEVAGLRPDRPYFYRFRAEGHLSPVGRTRTAPAGGSLPASATVGVVSCANWEEGFFTAYRHLAAEEPDLVLHLGDYLYESPEDPGTDATTGAGHVRGHLGRETRTLAAYRQRHAQYKTDPDLQAAHAAAPWAVVPDDHEVDANWAGATPQTPQPHFLRRRAAAFRAYYEHMPLRRSSLPRGATMPVFRRLAWGDLATVHLLDTRQYRYDQACGDTRVIGCTARLAPDRTMLGGAQERWLGDGLRASPARRDLLAQQVFVAPKDSFPGPLEEFAMDAWDGYPAARRRLLRSLTDVRNPVVLTGDVHRHYANDLLLDATTVAAELVTTSVSSGGDGSVRTALTDVQLAENPHLRWVDSRRGYVVLRLAPDRLRADFRTLPFVRRPGAPVSTAATFTLADGERGLRRG